MDLVITPLLSGDFIHLDFFKLILMTDSGDNKKQVHQCELVFNNSTDPDVESTVTGCDRCTAKNKCANYDICGTTHYQFLLDTSTVGTICKQCDIIYGAVVEKKTSEKKDLECPICYETVESMYKMVSCTHWYCVACFCELTMNIHSEKNKCAMCRQQQEAPWMGQAAKDKYTKSLTKSN